MAYKKQVIKIQNQDENIILREAFQKFITLKKALKKIRQNYSILSRLLRLFY